jgi:hypothetical protein
MKLNSRGQESAVFELLIAVIVMTFVIVFGMNAVDQMTKQKCVSEVNDSLSKMQLAIEAVSNGIQPRENVNFNIPTCYNYDEESVRISRFDDPKICVDKCPGSENLCTVLEYASPGAFLSKCLRVSYAMQFGTATSCSDFSADEYDAIDLITESTEDKKGIPPGRYILIKDFGREEFPLVCAYKRIQ